MYNEKISDDTNLNELIDYYLKNFNNPEIMDELKWKDPYLYLQITRLHFIKQLQDTTPTYKCPDCGDNIIHDEWGEEYCESCGLVTRTPYDYVAGFKITLPYGRK